MYSLYRPGALFILVLIITIIFCVEYKIFPGVILTNSPKKKLEPLQFIHSSHEGEVKKLFGQGTIKLDCNYCHQVNNDEKYKDGFGQYPCENLEIYKQSIKTKKVMHSACVECHKPQFTGRGAVKEMCLICHTQFGFNPKLPLRIYPSHLHDSDFSLTFQHKTHKRKVITTESDFNCTICHEVEKSGTYVSKSQHKSCFICHMEEVDPKYKDFQSEPYANDCAGCHPKASSNPFKDYPNQLTYSLVSATNEKGQVLFRHDGDHSVGQKIADTGKSLSCIYCHGNIGSESSRAKLKTEENRKKFLVSLYPEACADCHTLKKKPLIVGYISRTKQLGSIFGVSDCDKCHKQETIEKDLNYHKKQQK